ncbi:hypothetical protein ACFL5V_05465 [Fibrobacterota bacterium]
MSKQILFFVAMLLMVETLASSPLDSRVFSTETYVFIVHPGGLLSYSRKSRDFRGIVLDESRVRDSIIDVAENDGMLWLLAPYGIFQLDMGTGTVEKIPFLGEETCDGKIASDLDYVWLACPDSLMQFDKLGREWLAYPLEREKTERKFISTAFSNGDEVYCALPEGMQVFYITDEKWKSYPIPKGSLSGSNEYLYDEDNVLVIDADRIFRFLVSSRSWEVITADRPVADVVMDKEYLYYLDGEKAFSFSLSNSVREKFDLKPLDKAGTFNKINDSVFVISQGDNIVLYDVVNKSSQYLPYGRNMSGAKVEKFIPVDDLLLVITPGQLCIYDFSNKLWELFPRRKLRGGQKAVSWDEDGLAARYARGYSSTVKGFIDQEMNLNYLGIQPDSGNLLDRRRATDSLGNLMVDTAGRPVFENVYDSVPTFGYKIPDTDLDLTLHNAFPNGRYLDVYFNNSHSSDPVKKVIQYRGSPADRLQDGILGRNSFTIPRSQTLPGNQFEGAAAVVESSQKLKRRDRKLWRVSTGAGFYTTRTVNKIVPYPGDKGAYLIDSTALDSIRIIPGSLRIWVDGEELDSTAYSFLFTNGYLQFYREANLDPMSVISVSYQTETIPDKGIKEIELLPENNLGALGYGDVITSYTDWLSTRVAYVPLESESTTHHLAHVGVPVELRRKGLFLRLDPEFTYDTEGEAGAGGADVQGRIGERTSLKFRGLVADTGFITTDDLSTGYGGIKRDLDYGASYDVFKDLTIGYKQRNLTASAGEEDKFEVYSDIHFPRYPFFNISLSRNFIDARIDTSTASSPGSEPLELIQEKDKLRVKVYETSSPLLEKALNFNKLGYEFMQTEFVSDDLLAGSSGRGRIFYGRTVVSPVNSLSFTSANKYQKNPGGTDVKRDLYTTQIFQTIDAPPGFDLTGSYENKYKQYSGLDSSSVELIRSFNLIVKPGTWIPSLMWMSPRGGVSQTSESGIDEAYPGAGAILLGGEDPDFTSLTRTAGVHIVPYDDFFFNNKNDWSSSSSVSSFYTFNDLKLWYNGKRELWQTRYEFKTDYDRQFYQKGFMNYENVWRPWINTAQGLFFTFSEDSTTESLKMGPGFRIGLNVQDFWALKKIINNHFINIDWYRDEGDFVSSVPGLFYNLYLSINIKPNFFVILNNTLAFKTEDESDAWELETLSGKLFLQAFF